MFTTMIVVFVIGYLAIVSDHKIEVNKAATALITGMVLWGIYAVFAQDILGEGYSGAWNNHISELSRAPTLDDYIHFVAFDQLFEHLADISSILFFLMGAMSIVEVVDRFQGFRLITSIIKTRNFLTIIWIVSLLTFFMSAALDNLTTTIVMVTLARKLIVHKERRWLLVSMIIISANAGGAWSPIGDVTTIMLWIGGQVTSGFIIKSLILPSFISVLVPLIIVSIRTPKKIIVRTSKALNETETFTSGREQRIILFSGLACLLFVPIFKTYTHLPPFVGMLLGLGIMWVLTDVMLIKHPYADVRRFNLGSIIKKVDMPTIFFFMGILMAVAALSSAGQLDLMANILNDSIGNIYGINFIIGMLSAVVDNVPLVAGAMGMYDIAAEGSVGYLADFMVDGHFWTFLTYCAGIGGSLLIVGSAAGVAAMGMEKIRFMWYLKNIAWLAFMGYCAGALTYMLQYGLI